MPFIIFPHTFGLLWQFVDLFKFGRGPNFKYCNLSNIQKTIDQLFVKTELVLCNFHIFHFLLSWYSSYLLRLPIDVTSLRVASVNLIARDGARNRYIYEFYWIYYSFSLNFIIVLKRIAICIENNKFSSQLLIFVIVVLEFRIYEVQNLFNQERSSTIENTHKFDVNY